MAIEYFKLKIEGSDREKLQTIRSWIQRQITSRDFHDLTTGGVYPDNNKVTEFTTVHYLELDIYLKSVVNKVQFRDFIVERFIGLDKSGLFHAYLDRYDNGIHDDINPVACDVTRVLEWNSN